MAGEKKGARVKTCNRCGVGNLAWSKTAEGWALFPGVTRNGEWTADTSQPKHACVGEKKQGGGMSDEYQPNGPLRPLMCGCRVLVYMTEADLIRVGYPVCGTCQEFFEIPGVRENGDTVPAPEVIHAA